MDAGAARPPAGALGPVSGRSRGQHAPRCAAQCIFGAGVLACAILLSMPDVARGGAGSYAARPHAESFLARAAGEGAAPGGRSRLELAGVGDECFGAERGQICHPETVLERSEGASELAFVRGMMLPEKTFGGAGGPSTSARPDKVGGGAAAHWRPVQYVRIPRLNATDGGAGGPGSLHLHPATLSVIAKRRGGDSARARLYEELSAGRERPPLQDIMRSLRGKSPRGEGRGFSRPGRASSPGGMVSKLGLPPLSPAGRPLTLGHVRGDLVGKLRGLSGRFEMAQRIELAGAAPRADGAPSEVELYLRRARRRAAPQRTWHAPRAAHADPELPESDAWLEDARVRDAELVAAVASLLSNAAAAGGERRGGDAAAGGGGGGAGAGDAEARAAARERGTAFQALREPKVTVEEYAARIARYGACAPGCLALAVVYLDRFLARHGGVAVSVLNAHRLLLGCALVAAKQWEDSVFRNAFWAKVGGVSCAELNLLERELLRGLDFRLHVDKPEFDRYRAALVEWAQGRVHEPGSVARALARRSALFATAIQKAPLLSGRRGMGAQNLGGSDRAAPAQSSSADVLRRATAAAVMAPDSGVSAECREALAATA